MRPARPRHLRADRGGAARAAATSDPGRRGLAVPALRRLRPRRAAGTGPADEAPVVLRGKALRDATILRLFAVERWLRALVLVLLGVAVLRFKYVGDVAAQLFEQALPGRQAAGRAAQRRPEQQPHGGQDPSPARRPTRSTLTWVAVALFAYAAIQVAEGVGLWSLQRWGEYLAVVATSVLPAAGGLRADREDHLAAGRGLRGQPRAGRVPGRLQAAVRRPRWAGRRTSDERASVSLLEVEASLRPASRTA